MPSVLSWDCFMNMPGNIEAKLECVSISSASSDIGPLAVRKRNKSPEIEISEEEMPPSAPLSMETPPVCSGKGTRWGGTKYISSSQSLSFQKISQTSRCIFKSRGPSSTMQAPINPYFHVQRLLNGSCKRSTREFGSFEITQGKHLLI